MTSGRPSPLSEESPSDEMLPKEAEEEDRRLLLDKGREAMGEKDDEKEEEREEEDQHKPRKMAFKVARTILMAVTDLCCVRIYHFLKHIAYLTKNDPEVRQSAQFGRVLSSAECSVRQSAQFGRVLRGARTRRSIFFLDLANPS